MQVLQDSRSSAAATSGYATSPFIYRRPGNPPPATLRPEERAVLQAGTWFSSLSPALREAVLQRGRVRRVQAGAVVVQRGSHSANWIGVISGALRLGSPLADGRSFTLDILGPGQWFGDIAVVAHGANTLDAVAQVPSTLMEVSRGDLRELINEHAELRDAFLQLDCRRLRYMVQRFEELHTLSLAQRLACAVQRLMQRFGRAVDGGVSVELPLSQAELAALSGGSRQRVNRAIGQMQQLGILGCGVSRLLVQDEQRLAAVAEGRIVLSGSDPAH